MGKFLLLFILNIYFFKVRSALMGQGFVALTCRLFDLWESKVRQLLEPQGVEGSCSDSNQGGGGPRFIQ